MAHLILSDLPPSAVTSASVESTAAMESAATCVEPSTAATVEPSTTVEAASATVKPFSTVDAATTVKSISAPEPAVSAEAFSAAEVSATEAAVIAIETSPSKASVKIPATKSPAIKAAPVESAIWEEATAVVAVIPRAGANENSSDEIIRAVIPIRRARVGIIGVIAPLAIRRRAVVVIVVRAVIAVVSRPHANADGNLGRRDHRCGKKKSRYQCQIFEKSHSHLYSPRQADYAFAVSVHQCKPKALARVAS